MNISLQPDAIERDSFHLTGAVEFGTSNIYCSVPVYRRNYSNYIWIPDVDREFRIIRFNSYQNISFTVSPHQVSTTTRVGDKIPLPVLDGVGNVTWLDVDHIQHIGTPPNVTTLEQMTSVGRSLIERTKKSFDNYSREDNIEEISSSRYWVTRFLRAIEQGSITTDERDRYVEQWLSSYRSKVPVSRLGEMIVLRNKEDQVVEWCLRLVTMLKRYGMAAPRGELARLRAAAGDGLALKLPRSRIGNQLEDALRAELLIAGRYFLRREVPEAGADPDDGTIVEVSVQKFRNLRDYAALIAADSALIDDFATDAADLYFSYASMLNHIVGKEREFRGALGDPNVLSFRIFENARNVGLINVSPQIRSALYGSRSMRELDEEPDYGLALDNLKTTLRGVRLRMIYLLQTAKKEYRLMKATNVSLIGVNNDFFNRQFEN